MFVQDSHRLQIAFAHVPDVLLIRTSVTLKPEQPSFVCTVLSFWHTIGLHTKQVYATCFHCATVPYREQAERHHGLRRWQARKRAAETACTQPHCTLREKAKKMAGSQFIFLMAFSMLPTCINRPSIPPALNMLPSHVKGPSSSG